MSFYVCPGANRPALKLLQASSMVHCSERLPLAERARLFYEKVRPYRARAESLCERSDFKLGNNQFYLHLLASSVETGLVVSVLSQLAAMFTGRTIGIWFVDHKLVKDFKLGVVVWVIDEKIALPANRFTVLPKVEKKKVFRLEYELSRKEMYLGFIMSKRSDAGGQALAGLYLIAKQLGLGRINYYVKENNKNARQFYLHTDFGKPVDTDMVNWEVAVK